MHCNTSAASAGMRLDMRYCRLTLPRSSAWACRTWQCACLAAMHLTLLHCLEERQSQSSRAQNSHCCYLDCKQNQWLDSHVWTALMLF